MGVLLRAGSGYIYFAPAITAMGSKPSGKRWTLCLVLPFRLIWRILPFAASLMATTYHRYSSKGSPFPIILISAHPSPYPSVRLPSVRPFIHRRLHPSTRPSFNAFIRFCICSFIRSLFVSCVLLFGFQWCCQQSENNTWNVLIISLQWFII